MAQAKSRTGNGKGRGCLVLFFLPFLAAGCAVAWFVGLGPYLKSQAAADWIPTPCEIVHSEVTSSTSDGSTSYGIDIHFRYEHQGRRYISDSYDFTDVSTSGRDAKAQVVAAHPVGSEATCWVNPEDPAEAVIDREPGGAMWWGLFGLPFILVGLGGIWFSLRGPRLRTRAFSRKARRTATRASDPDGAPTGSSGELDAGSSPVGRFVGMLVTAVVWNGIVGTIGYFAILKEGFDGGFDWFPAIFLGLFALIGAGLLLVGVPYQFLALFNPHPTVRIDDGPLRVGGTARLEWELSGRYDRLQRFTIAVVGREVARYRRGTNTYTDRKTFLRHELFQGIDPADALSGSCELTLPPDAVPSFDGGNNQIEWQLEVRGDIPMWPDVKVDFPLQVAPPEMR